MAIKENLRALMDHRGLTEYRLAAETGVPQPTIHRILSGESLDPKTATVRPLAAFFGVTVEDLRGTSPEIQIGEAELSPEAMEFARLWLSLPRARRQAHYDGIYLESEALKYGVSIKGRVGETTGRFAKIKAKK